MHTTHTNVQMHTCKNIKKHVEMNDFVPMFNIQHW